MANEKNKPSAEEYEKLGKAVEKALINDYINWLGNTKRMIFQSFIRGVFTGFGGVIGATVVVALLVWILNLVGHVPGLGPILKDTTDQIKQ